MFACSFGSTLLNVGHIILPPPVSMKYWNNCPLERTVQALTFKGNCKYTINDITQRSSLFYNKGKMCESGRCQNQPKKFVNLTSLLLITVLCILNILTEKKNKLTEESQLGFFPTTTGSNYKSSLRISICGQKSIPHHLTFTDSQSSLSFFSIHWCNLNSTAQYVK